MSCLLKNSDISKFQGFSSALHIWWTVLLMKSTDNSKRYLHLKLSWYILKIYHLGFKTTIWHFENSNLLNWLKYCTGSRGNCSDGLHTIWLHAPVKLSNLSPFFNQYKNQYGGWGESEKFFVARFSLCAQLTGAIVDEEILLCKRIVWHFGSP